MFKKFKPGDQVWVVERDEGGNAFDVSGYLFLAEVEHTIIVTPRVFGCGNLKEIMSYHVDQTAQDWNTDLSVYPAEDCYLHRSEAEEVLADETEDDDD